MWKIVNRAVAVWAGQVVLLQMLVAKMAVEVVNTKEADQRRPEKPQEAVAPPFVEELVEE